MAWCRSSWLLIKLTAMCGACRCSSLHGGKYYQLVHAVFSELWRFANWACWCAVLGCATPLVFCCNGCHHGCMSVSLKWRHLLAHLVVVQCLLCCRGAWCATAELSRLWQWRLSVTAGWNWANSKHWQWHARRILVGYLACTVSTVAAHGAIQSSTSSCGHCMVDIICNFFTGSSEWHGVTVQANDACAALTVICLVPCQICDTPTCHAPSGCHNKPSSQMLYKL